MCSNVLLQDIQTAFFALLLQSNSANESSREAELLLRRTPLLETRPKSATSTQLLPHGPSRIPLLPLSLSPLPVC